MTHEFTPWLNAPPLPLLNAPRERLLTGFVATASGAHNDHIDHNHIDHIGHIATKIAKN